VSLDAALRACQATGAASVREAGAYIRSHIGSTEALIEEMLGDFSIQTAEVEL